MGHLSKKETDEPSTRTKYLYHLMCNTAYLFGAPNYYYKQLDLPKFILTIHDGLSKITDIVVYLFMAAECGAFLTQDNLTEKQRSDLMLFCLAQPFFFAFGQNFALHVDTVRDMAYSLAIRLKEYHNDIEVENEMVMKVKFYLSTFTFFGCSAVVMYGFDALYQVITSNKNFITVVTVWPDIDDTSLVAGIFRVVIFIVWHLYMIRMISGFIILIPLTVCLSHQYKNLYSYFYSLNDIFKETISNEEKQRKYEKSVKLGIYLHSETLRCTRQMQNICNIVYSAQIVVNVVVILLLMFEMLDPARDMSKTLIIIITAFGMLTSTGCLMWNAGDITSEAASLATAMFHSGWQHCERQTSRRVRSLLVIAMNHSQKTVELTCLGVVKLSYEWYLKIVRTSYSIFSVLY